MPKSERQVVMLEFNELVPRLMDQFIAEGHLPNFDRLRRGSCVYTTDAEESGENLNPWVQWVTVHSGLSAEHHGISRLSDGHKLTHKAVWDLLSEAGYRVWVCGSMNARYDKPLNGCLLPDPWSTGLTPFPKTEFDAFNKFVRFSVQEHTNKQAALSKGDTLRFLTYMATHGLSYQTVRMILRQIWTERRTGRFRWRRAAILDRLQFDVFRHYFRRFKPHFSTFFINSTAHFQHDFWRNMEPDAFAIKPSETEQSEYRDAILYGYMMMDSLIGEFMKLAGPNTTIIFCTGLSQQPYLQYENSSGRHYYRLHASRLLSERLGIADSFTYHPVMASEFCLRFNDAAAAERGAAVLQDHRFGERCAFAWKIDGNSVHAQCSQTGIVASDAEIVCRTSKERIPFYDIFYTMDVVKSGYHHPEGMLWIQTPDEIAGVREQKVSLRCIAPTVLRMFDVAAPPFMDSPPLDFDGSSDVVTTSATRQDWVPA